ncbi:MAG TPA: hypothetical protein DEQ23_05355 [Chlorobium sp.]|nr:hypothetical protein [Chlorobium sp.]
MKKPLCILIYKSFRLPAKDFSVGSVFLWSGAIPAILQREATERYMVPAEQKGRKKCYDSMKGHALHIRPCFKVNFQTDWFLKTNEHGIHD